MSHAKAVHPAAHAVDPALGEVSEQLRARMQESPYQTLAAALGVGFFVGGGLWKPVAQALLAWGAKLALAKVVSHTEGSDA